MANYFSELGEMPDHTAPVLMIRLLKDSGNFELLQMVLEMSRESGGNVAAAVSKEEVKNLPNLPSVDPPKNGNPVNFCQA
jgi:hypothetical protein